MFFRRRRATVVTFEDCIGALEAAGFGAQPQEKGVILLTKGDCAAEIRDIPGGLPRVGRTGLAMGGEIGLLIDGGYQKFFQTPLGTRVPAQASQLEALHDFQEDLREALGLVSQYHESLGTVCNLHVYDRMQGRE